MSFMLVSYPQLPMQQSPVAPGFFIYAHNLKYGMYTVPDTVPGTEDAEMNKMRCLSMGSSGDERT